MYLSPRSTALRAPVAAATGVLTMVGLLSFQAAQAPDASASTTYTWSNASSLVASWSPPSDGVIEVTVRSGAGGGAPAMFSGNESSAGGNGAEITVTRTVLATDGFIIRVYPGGGAGGNCGNLGGGGPSAFIYVDNTDAVVAGGGGGGGCNGASSASPIIPGDGGNAGVPTSSATFAGNDGGDADNGDPTNIVRGGGGGQSAAGGAGGTGYNYSSSVTCCTGTSGFPYSSYPTATGGQGGTGTGVGGGGGGGRYGGGGGGGSGASAGAGGGGGASYVSPDWTFVSARSTSSTGGEIVIVFTAANDADLSNLQLSQGILSPTFAAGTTAYTATVASSVTSLTVTPTASASGAGITVNGVAVTSGSPSGAIPLSPGSNTLTIVVTALDTTTTKTYTVTVTRALSSNAELSGLAVDTGSLSPSFSSAVTAYTVNAPPSASSIVVTPTAADVGSTVTVDGSAVTSGTASAPITLGQASTVISIVVTASDSSTLTYTITVVLSSEDRSSQIPPSWYQAYERFGSDTPCREGWDPSWAQWPRDGAGGWTCERTIYWNVNLSDWSEDPGFRSSRR